jgi:hypothetical protein
MKKHRGAIIVFFLIYLFVWNIANANELDDVMGNIENDLDTCIETKDTKFCQQLFLNDVMGPLTGDYKLLVELQQCKPGDKCYSASYRIMMKTMTASNLAVGEY